MMKLKGRLEQFTGQAYHLGRNLRECIQLCAQRYEATRELEREAVKELEERSVGQYDPVRKCWKGAT